MSQFLNIGYVLEGTRNNGKRQKENRNHGKDMKTEIERI